MWHYHARKKCPDRPFWFEDNPKYGLHLLYEFTRKSPSETTSVFASGWQIVYAMGYPDVVIIASGNLKLHFLRRRIFVVMIVRHRSGLCLRR